MVVDDIVVDGLKYRRTKDGDWVQVVSKACDSHVYDVAPFLDKIERLQRWKAEATAVLERWDEVAAMCDLRLGEFKPVAVAREIERLLEQVEDLRMHAEQDACEIHRLRTALALTQLVQESEDAGLYDAQEARRG